MRSITSTRFTGLMGLTAVVVAPWLAGCASTGASGTTGPGWLELFDGKSLDGWKGQSRDGSTGDWQAASNVELAADDPAKLAITPGESILVNGPKGRTCNLYTTQEFGDCELYIEFTVPKGSNSGVYFQGEYEIQVFDSFGKETPTFSDCGGIYARWVNNQNVEGHPPRMNVSKAPGEWQYFRAIFEAPRFDADGKKTRNARFVKVIHNGTVVHENLELNGPTRAGMTGKEKPLGPIMLQGDHGPVAYRNIRIKPMK